MNKISERILKLMKDSGITEYRLTKMADITAGTLNRTLKAGNAWKQAEQLYKISRVLNESIDFLITGNKTAQDENERVSKLREENNKLRRDCQKLKERQRKLKSDLKDFIEENDL